MSRGIKLVADTLIGGCSSEEYDLIALPVGPNLPGHCVWSLTQKLSLNRQKRLQLPPAKTTVCLWHAPNYPQAGTFAATKKKSKDAAVLKRRS